jgi:hypothetical protein
MAFEHPGALLLACRTTLAWSRSLSAQSNIHMNSKALADRAEALPTKVFWNMRAFRNQYPDLPRMN